MAKSKVLIEIVRPVEAPFEMQAAAAASPQEAESQARSALSAIGVPAGLELDAEMAPVPMLLGPSAPPASQRDVMRALESLAGPAPAPLGVAASTGQSIVVAATVDEGRLAELTARQDMIVWPNSELTLLGPAGPSVGAAANVDCDSRPGVTIEKVREVLNVAPIWDAGFKGKGIVVGIVDEGIDGTTYAVSGGFSLPGAQQPGTAGVTSHGSMCAADVLIAAPEARLFDYPFLGIPNSGGALQMFHAILDKRRAEGIPHITNSSYGFVAVPDKAMVPKHEVHDLDHPVHRKVREVVAAGVVCFFAAGNCGKDCPDGRCKTSGIGPGRSIHASNSLAEVITIAAVNSLRERIGYSSQGPGLFEQQKPDLACYSHIFANFGEGRPGGTVVDFDSGTSAATPVAVGVAALLLHAFKTLTPAALKAALIDSAVKVGGATGWDRDFGHGVIDAGAAFELLSKDSAPVG
jgi:serine protease AprX